jgi:DNA-binding NtrC family response regulator
VPDSGHERNFRNEAYNSFSMQPRSERKSLFVPVWCSPRLEGCWSVNVSELGMGLIARPMRASDGPREGEVVELEFPLPPGPRVRVRGVVRWRHESSDAEHGVTSSLGVRFESFEGDGQLELRRFLSEHRLRVVVAGADRTLERALGLAFEGEIQLLFRSDPSEVETSLERGDIAAVLILGDDEFAAVALAQLIESTARAATVHLSRPPEVKPRVVFAATAADPRLVELFNAGAIDQVLPPDAPVTQLRDAVLSACRDHEVRLQQQRMSIELERLLRERSRSTLDVAAGVEGPGFTSASMREVIAQVRQAAPYRVTVLLQGETGTGKELLARRLHELSPRNGQPFVVQDCGALPETLLESELFGHVRGAFTGAVSDHPGLFVLADGGSIFLDEIENTTPNLQAKLLRIIETGEVRPVGGAQVRRVDVRVATASNRMLAEEVRAGRFRSDLYFRLNPFTIDVPPLRERRDDVLPLAKAFVESFNEALGKSARGFTPEAEGLLLDYDWPGNVRELRNVVERAVLLSAPMEPLSPARLPRTLARTGAPRKPDGLRGQLDAFERRLIADALERHEGVVRRAALDLKIDAVTLARRARRLKVL